MQHAVGNSRIPQITIMHWHKLGENIVWTSVIVKFKNKENDEYKQIMSFKK